MQTPRQKRKETGGQPAIIPRRASQLLRLVQRVTVPVDQKPCPAQEIERSAAVCLQLKQPHKWIARNAKQPHKFPVRKPEI